MLTRRKFMTGTSAMMAMSMTPMWLRAAGGVVVIPEGLQLIPYIPLQYTKLIARYLVNNDYYAHFNILYDEWNLVEAKLVEVRDGPSRNDQEEFSMVFHTTWEPKLEEKTYMFDHPIYGQFPMYLRPIESEAGGYAYEVTVSRLLALQ